MNHGNTETLENYTSARGTELPPPFLNILFTYLFSKNLLYFFISLSLISLVRVHIHTTLCRASKRNFARRNKTASKWDPRDL